MNKPEFLIALFAFVSAPITLPHSAPLQALVAWQTPDALRAVPAAWSFAATSTSPALQAPSAVTTDRTDAASTAAAILRAYASKDLPAMADLSTADNRQIIRELIAQGEAHPRWRSIFSGGRWHAVITWNGVLGEVRYQERTPSTGRVIDARVQFAEAETPGKLVVVSLTWEAGKWCFEDVNFPSRESFTSWSKDKPKLPPA